MKPVQTALFLSPHLDDVAFSCGGIVAKLGRMGMRTVVATAFTASLPADGFALACQLDKGLAPDVDYMALRRAEDAVAMRILGAEARCIELPEAPHRGYGSAAELFGDRRDDDRIDVTLGKALTRLLAELDPVLVLAPQGLGRHVDHIQTIRAVLDIVPIRLLGWYRDTPYAIREPAALPDPRTLPAHDVAVRLERVELGRKIAAARAYTTQLMFQFGGPTRAGRSLRAFAEQEGRGALAERLLLHDPDLANLFTQSRLAMA